MIDQFTNLSLEQRIGQLFFVGIAGPTIDSATEDLLDEIEPGGICLFARNIKELGQTRQLLDGVRARSAVVPFLSIDEEGGLVDRLRRVMSPVPAASRLVKPEDAALTGRLIGETLRLLGFNLNFAPVVDIVTDSRRSNVNGLSSRTFGTSSRDVVEFATAFLESMQKCGIVGCVKHFPGLAAARVDSHEELPEVELDAAELFDLDLFPYRQMLPTGIVDAVMVAHASFPRHPLQEIDSFGRLLPSSLSRRFVSGMLRDELNFTGLVITDDMEMGAIVKNYGIGTACNMAVNAGVDMLAICADPDKIREGFYAVKESVENGEIAPDRIDESLRRIATVKAKLVEPTIFDPLRLKEISTDIEAFAGQLAK